MNIKEIVEKHLRERGFDGLYCKNCGCHIDDLFPCDTPDFKNCKPGYLCNGNEPCPLEGAEVAPDLPCSVPGCRYIGPEKRE